MTIPISDLFTPKTADQWLSAILGYAGALSLPATQWQPFGIARTSFAVMAHAFSPQDAVVSAMAQGGFLDYAATGTVTYTAQTGPDTFQDITVPVTPDPSIPAQNPTGAPGWLDVLANSVYDVQREQAQAASGVLAIANTGAGSFGPYAAGTYHVANPSTGATYANQATLTIAPGTYVGSGILTTSSTPGVPVTVTTNSAHGRSTGDTVYIAGVLGPAGAGVNGFWTITVTSGTQFSLNGSNPTGSFTSGGAVLVCQTADFAADAVGTSGTSAANQITQAVTSNSGVLVDNTVPFFGTNYESNVNLAARCRAKIQALSSGSPSGAYEFFALSAQQLAAERTPPYLMSAPITRAITQANPVTGVVDVIVANDAGAVEGCANLQVTNATNATPIVVTTASPHNMQTGDSASIKGVLGNTDANGTWTVTKTGAATFSLNGSSGNAAYVSGGVVDGGDLGGVDLIIQANAVPDAVTAVVESASSFAVAVIATVVVPQAQVAAYTAAAQSAMALYQRSLEIGNPKGGGVVPYLDVAGLLWAAGSVGGQLSYVVTIPSLTVNGLKTDVAYPDAKHVAVLTLTLTVQGV